MNEFKAQLRLENNKRKRETQLNSKRVTRKLPFEEMEEEKDNIMQVLIRYQNKCVGFDVSQCCSLGMLKTLIEMKEGVPSSHQKLYHAARFLQDNKLRLCDIGSHSGGLTMELMLGLPGGRAMQTILIGNPGVGKSSILNGLLQDAQFRSGVRLGTGVTQIFDKYTDRNGNVYCDTPGLSDLKLRDQAAREIVRALRQGGLFKVIFVITLEEGRIRPDDKTTMDLVLRAATDIGSSYSIIVNKVSREVEELFQDQEQAKEFYVLLNEGLPKTYSVFINSYDSEIAGKKDRVPNLSGQLLDFIRDAPIVNVNTEQVSDIQISNFEQVKQELEAQIQNLKNEKDERTEQMEEKLRNQAADYASWKAATESNEQQHRAEIARYQGLIDQERRERENRGNGRILEGLIVPLVGAVTRIFQNLSGDA